jgi:3-oxoacyl-[acyl-carrier-protein] synthase III
MTSRIHAGITGVGKYFPERIVKNADLEKIVDTNDEWIRTRTGIEERRFVEPGVGASDLALPASRQALEMAGVTPDQIDCIIFATVTPDNMFPSAACTLQAKLGATKAWAFDLSGACSGWVYALAVADGLIRGGMHETVLVVGADVMTSILDFEDRNTCVLFGDGAGATLLQKLPDGEEGILGHDLGADGEGGQWLYMTAGGSAKPASHETVDNREHYVVQNGQQVFKAAVDGMAQVSVGLLERLGLTGDQVDLFVPHQANLRIIDYARKRAGLPMEKVMVTIDKFGNTTAGTIPTSLCIAAEEGRVKRGDLVLVATFGAGFTWGASAIRWTAPEL